MIVSLRTAVFAASLIALGPSLGVSAAEPLVDGAWLAGHLSTPNLVVLDVRSPGEQGPADLFAQGHIPGAVPADYARAGWRTTVGGVPGELPPAAEIGGLIGALGIGDADHVVIVSEGETSTDFGAAARVYWTFKVTGHDEVSILEGGYAGWVADGRGIETGAGAPPQPASYTVSLRPELLATKAEVQAALASGEVPLIDARPTEQYTGENPPANVGVAGTIPGAISLPHSTLIPDGHDPVTRETLAGYLSQFGVKPEGEQIAFCNTGHWAAADWFVLHEVGGNPDVKLYDGSMVEWVQDPSLPVEAGASRIPQ
jgi:thiosulfate/3-mercaptopyruvate sulfurtransferase